MDYPEHPTHRPDPSLRNGRKGPDARKRSPSKAPLVAAVIAILGLALVAAVTTYQSQQQAERAPSRDVAR